MKTLIFALRLLWLLALGALFSLILVPDLRELLPADVWSMLEPLPYAREILGWPDEVTAPLIVVALGLLSALWVIWGALRGGPGLRDIMELKPSVAKAKALVRMREIRAAAQVYAEIKRAPKGARLLFDNGHRGEALQLLLEHGHRRKAFALLVDIDGRDAEMAAGLLDKAGHPDQAREMFCRAGDYHAERNELGRAGRSYYRAGEFERARVFLEKSWEQIFRPDAPVEVAEMLLEVGAVHAAGLAYSRAAASFEDGDQKRKLSKKAAVLLAKGGDPASGAQLLERVGLVSDAAELYAHAGEIDRAVTLLASIRAGARAAEILIKVGQIERAVDLYVDAGEISKAAELAIKNGNIRQGASLLDRIGNSASAIKLLEEAGEYGEAAEMLRVSGDPLRAASMYERAEAWERAAAIYESAGEELRAALLYGRGNRRSAAARIYLKHGRIREASEVLGGVVDEDSRPLHGELGARYAELGDSAKALEHLMAAASGDPLSAQNMGVYFHLAKLYEQLGDDATALSLYQQVHSINPYVEGLAQRIEQCQGRQMAALQQGPPATPQVTVPGDSRYAETMGGFAPEASTGVAGINTETGSVEVADASDRYRIEGELGRGAMGQVVRAFDTVLQRAVALKFLPEALASDAGARSSFMAEARAAASLHHPNIVTIYDIGLREGLPYFAMELVENGELKNYLQTRPQLSLGHRLLLLSEVASALAAAHGHGVVHRDVKPSNILVDAQGHARLADFGIARARHQQQSGQSPQGTPLYMSPEQARGDEVDLRSDLYSLGVVMFEIVSGRRPFDGDNVVQQHLQSPAPALRSVFPKAPPVLEQLVARCLQKAPADRPASASDICKALQTLAGAGPVSAA